MLSVAKCTGLRSSETRHLEWRDTPWESYRHLLPRLDGHEAPDFFINRELGVVVVRNTKNGETRSVPLDGTLTEVPGHITLQPSGAFVSRRADGTTHGGVERALKAAVHMAGLRDSSFPQSAARFSLGADEERM